MIPLDEEHQELIDLTRQRIEAVGVDFTRLTPFLNQEESLGLAGIALSLRRRAIA